MAIGLRTREVLAITVLTFLVVAATTLLHVAQLTRITVRNGVTQAELVSRQLYNQARRSLTATSAADPWEVLRADRELRTLVEASVAYSPDLLSVLLADEAGQVRLHSERELEGRVAAPRPALQVLFARNPINRLVALYSDRIYEVPLALQLGDRPFGTVRVAISTSLLRRDLTASLKQALGVAAVALVCAWLLALGLAQLVLQPLRSLSKEVRRLGGRGQAEEPAAMGQGDEFSALASQLQMLGQQLESDRLKILSEKTQLQQVVDRLEDPLVFCGAAGEVLYLNAAAENVLALRLEETAGEGLVGLLDPGHPLVPLFRRALEEGGLRNTTVSLPVEGKAKEFLVSAFRVGGPAESRGTMILLKDLDSIRTLRSLVTYSAKLTALGRLFSGVAHEVKNPLNAMMIHVEVLREKLSGMPDGIHESLNVIGKEIRRLDRAVQGFLKFIRPQELALQPVDVNALLGDAVELLRPEWEGHGVRFATAFGAGLPLATADPELLRQALLNILLNACQAMPEGGTVRVETAAEDGEAVRVLIADQGVGIPAEDLDRVFALYYTTKPEGSGIGLSLVYRIVQLHDGSIHIASEVGKGTTITLRLPVG